MINTTPIRFLLYLLLLSNLFSGSLTVIAVGDIMMGTTYPEINLPAERGRRLFQNVDSILAEADLTLGNLEGVLISGGVCTKHVEKGRCYAFRTPPDFSHNLADAGFDFMNLANNHMNDFGSDGIVSTIKVLDELDIQSGGPHKRIGQFEINGQKIVIICFATSPNTHSIFEIEDAQELVAALSRLNDIVIVSFHGGAEGPDYLHTRDTLEYFLGTARGNVVAFARAVVDSGADFVWGHGPHVPRALEMYKDKLIAYSLGNFLTCGFNLGDERGFAPILRIVLDSTGTFRHGRIISAWQKSYGSLRLDSLHNAAQLIKRLSVEDFPNSAPYITIEGIILPKRERPLKKRGPMTCPYSPPL